MPEFTQHDDKPFLRLALLHDDEAGRKFGYTSGAEQASNASSGWTVDSIKSDWAKIF